MFNVISVTRGWAGVQFPENLRYVTLEWPHIGQGWYNSPTSLMQYRFDLHSDFLRFAGHTVAPLFLHCRWIAQQPTDLTRWLQSIIMCMVVCFGENAAPVAILAADCN